jgi:hypothetical protein
MLDGNGKMCKRNHHGFFVALPGTQRTDRPSGFPLPKGMTSALWFQPLKFITLIMSFPT